MDKNELHCALCKIVVKTIQYNLKMNNSKFSDRPLMLVLESITENFPMLHCDICLQCYDLLNEFDAIELRQIEIKNLFKKYLKCPLQVLCTTTEDLPKYLMNEKRDINVLQPNETTQNNSTSTLSDSSDIECTDLSELDTKSIECNTNEENKPILNEIPSKKTMKKKKQPDVLKPHKCHCLKEFRTAGELKNHMNSHNDYRAFVCEICGQSYKHKTAFNIHMDMHKGINPFVCVYCNKAFTQKGALARHVPIHTGEMPYQCDECGKRFVHHTSFNVHRLSHTGLKSYKCDLCGLALTSASHLKRHKRIHTGEKKFACSTCGKCFAEKYNLAVHEKLHTNPCPNVPQKRSYSCQVCGVSFERKAKVDEHLAKEHQIKRSELDNKNVFKESDSQ